MTYNNDNNRQPGQSVSSIDKKKQQFPMRQEVSRRPHALSIIASIGIILVIVLGFAFISIRIRAGSTKTASGNPVVPVVPSAYTGYGSLNHVKGPCGNTSKQPACPAPTPDWFSVPSETPAGLISAITRGEDFLSMQSEYGYQTLDTPALVHTLAVKTGISYYDYDHVVVSVLNASHQRVGIFDFDYDEANHRMAFSAYGVITPTDPHAKMAFPYISAQAASAVLHQQRHLTMMPSHLPELVFFDINPNFRNLQSPVHLWSGGGDSPLDPMWQFTGTNGQTYCIGTDQHVYTPKDLPIART